MRALLLTTILLRLCTVNCFDITEKSFVSPLDDSDSIAQLKVPFPFEDGYSVDECDNSCVKPLLNAVERLIRSENRIGAIGNICRKYTQSEECVKRRPHCKAYDTFDVAMSGIKYMCVEQKDECLQLCNPASIATGYALQNIFKDVPILRKLDAHMPTIMTSEVCRIARCFMDCCKMKFNSRCEGSAGSLLAEVVVRAFSSSQRSVGAMPLFGALVASLPIQCNFLSNEQVLDSYRIDQRLNEDIKRIYSRRSAMKPHVILEELDAEFSPWKLPDYLAVDQLSPLEFKNVAVMESRIRKVEVEVSKRLQKSLNGSNSEQPIEQEGSGSEW
ncbi:unnamed protein product [Toxocara canis]|uniref:CPG4 domain-containing protein n=1 Tax=Toxocara canis TaxID=6265 RepID=A0A183VE58_TOXCA|nr:unnamed protein product [Toxocara canis]